jgi:hypothetical protein
LASVTNSARVIAHAKFSFDYATGDGLAIIMVICHTYLTFLSVLRQSRKHPCRRVMTEECAFSTIQSYLAVGFVLSLKMRGFASDDELFISSDEIHRVENFEPFA